jgi:tetratricopeptide (TPR) repeat protein
MATLQTDEANILDAESINWQAIVYPILVVLIVVGGVLGYYYYQQSMQDQAETQARAALVKATTPEEFLKVAADFPATDQATLATLAAAHASFAKRDFDSAISAYDKVINNTAIGAEWRDTAQLGIASCDEAKGDSKAVSDYLVVARRAELSPFAPYAYNCAIRICDARGDKDQERALLGQAAALAPYSDFTKAAQEKLKEMTPQAQPMSFPIAPSAAPAAPSPQNASAPGTPPANPPAH